MQSSTSYNVPDLLLEAELESLNIHETDEPNLRCFQLLDSKEMLSITNIDNFIGRLGIQDVKSKVKVVSIFGNAGEGKSHTMNNLFFEGDEVFKTCSDQISCTMGVWVAFQPILGAIVLDTEGILGTTLNENKRMRMLLKVLAISDVIVYRTRSERLHSDLFQFLGTASKAFQKHFTPILQAASTKFLGPEVVIFHETRNTSVLKSSVEEGPEDFLRNKFEELHLKIDAFNSIRYVGIQTKKPPTDYNVLRDIIRMDIENVATRPGRTIKDVFELLKQLNDKFSGEINGETVYTFHEQHFTCSMVCESCNKRCENTVDHSKDGVEHKSSNTCTFQPQFDNKMYLCKYCDAGGRKVVVRLKNHNSNETAWIGIAKFAWTGYIIDCPNCGEIFRSRQYWYGNKSPENVCVLQETIHVWKDSPKMHGTTNTHSAQVILDGISYLSDTLTSVSAQPTKSLSSWVADKIVNPAYWKPNSEIINCFACKINFSRNNLRIHHCRNCGEGFCNPCSKNKMAVQSRGWSDQVRVCNNCRDDLLKKNDIIETQESAEVEAKVRVRKYGEAVVSTFSQVASVASLAKDFVKDSARPAYWTPDHLSPRCIVCNVVFGNADEQDKTHLLCKSSATIETTNKVDSGGSSANSSPSHLNAQRAGLGNDIKRHHCRSCGHPVCNPCSINRRPVPERGWMCDVRVCNKCESLKK